MTTTGHAVFSPDGRFRHVLTRRWGDGPALAWCCLCPSRAGAPPVEDPSSRKIRGFTERLGFRAFDLVNLYPYVATDWRDCVAAGYPIPPESDGHLESVLRWAPKVICAWGAHAERLNRPNEVRRMLRAWNVATFSLRITRGNPHHPLMLPYSAADELMEF